MKGDISRDTFVPAKRYSSVRMQMGRVQTDADWNEQSDVTRRRIEREAWDIIGGCGAPLVGGGFEITVQGGQLRVNPGRYYVQGALVENDALYALNNQPDLPGYVVPTTNGLYIAYLETWEWHLTALSDDEIREKALGGPDTATRLKRVWQVKLLPVPAQDNPEEICLEDLAAWTNLVADSTMTMAAQAPNPDPTDRPCIVDPEAGFRRLENQLYRVEYHGQVNGQDVFKWSRDNGSVMATWTGKNGNTLSVADTGRDRNLSFKNGDWVELCDDGTELRREGGTIVKIGDVADGAFPIAQNPYPGSTTYADFPTHPRIRRWDMPDGLVEVDTNFTPLEDGVEVAFTAGTARPGDYWLVPARVATGDVEWPRDPNTNQALFLPPHGIERGFCKLAVVQRTGQGWQIIQDCRNVFTPLTRMAQLEYVSGDGQEASTIADANGLFPLPAQLQVGVQRGNIPLVGVDVRFSVRNGSGRLTGNVASAIVATDADGLAQIGWALDGATEVPMVEAEYIDVLGNRIGLPVRFVASRGVERGGSCETTVGADGEYGDLETAIQDVYINRGMSAAKFCLLPGIHELKNPIKIDGDDPEQSHIRYFEVHGFGDSSRLVAGNNPIVIHRVREVRFTNFAIRFNDVDRALFVHEVNETFLEDMGILLVTKEKPGYTVYADRIATIRATRCGFGNVDEKDQAVDELGKVLKVKDKEDLYHIRGQASERTEEISLALVKDKLSSRVAAAKRFRNYAKNVQNEFLQQAAITVARSLELEEIKEDQIAFVTFQVVAVIRQAIFQTNRAAIVIEEASRDVDFEQCEIGGPVVLGGPDGGTIDYNEISAFTNETRPHIPVQGRGFFRFENNMMVRIDVGAQTLKQIRELVEKKVFASNTAGGPDIPPLHGLWSIHLVDNHILDFRSIVAAENIHWRGNLLYAAANIAAINMGTLSTYLGNHGALCRLRNYTLSNNPPADVNTGVTVN